MTTPRHPATGQFTPASGADQLRAAAAPMETANHDQREADLAETMAACAVPPGQSPHALAMAAGPDDAYGGEQGAGGTGHAGDEPQG